ncbi:MAG: hypothetical protein SGJ20_11695 [Planctomycetota bacterium]|nr:hypothetical protein [Planctomycetota bacterium]
MEPEKHYCWQKTRVEGVFANVLFGESPQKGSVDCEEGEWNGWNDPLFTAALEVVEEELNWHQGFEWDLKPLFRLQMAYLLLWSSIERYVSLRYHLGDKATQKVKQLAEEQAFVDGLRQHVHTRHTLGRANQPTKKVTLDPDSPVKSVMFYYQIRSNIVHRGKGVVRDHRVLKDALTQLLPIFRAVLKAAEEDARSTDREMESTPTATLERSSNGVLPIFQFLPVPNAVDVLFDL